MSWAEKTMFIVLKQNSRAGRLVEGRTGTGTGTGGSAGWKEDTWALTRDKMTGSTRQQHQARGPKTRSKKEKIQKQPENQKVQTHPGLQSPVKNTTSTQQQPGAEWEEELAFMVRLIGPDGGQLRTWAGLSWDWWQGNIRRLDLHSQGLKKAAWSKWGNYFNVENP